MCRGYAMFHPRICLPLQLTPISKHEQPAEHTWKFTYGISRCPYECWWLFPISISKFPHSRMNSANWYIYIGLGWDRLAEKILYFKQFSLLTLVWAPRVFHLSYAGLHGHQMVTVFMSTSYLVVCASEWHSNVLQYTMFHPNWRDNPNVFCHFILPPNPPRGAMISLCDPNRDS